MLEQVQILINNGEWSQATHYLYHLWNYGQSLPPEILLLVSKNFFKLDAFAEARNCLQEVLVNHPNHIEALKEQRDQYFYHAYSSWLMKTVEGISDWYKIDGLENPPNWQTVLKMSEQFVDNKPSYSVQSVRTYLLLSEEYWECQDSQNAMKTLEEGIKSFAGALPISLINTIVNFISEIRQNKLILRDELTHNIQKEINTTNTGILSVNEWLFLYDVLNWNGLFEVGLVAREKAIQRVYQQVDAQPNDATALIMATRASIDQGNLTLANQFVNRLAKTNCDNQQLNELLAYKYLHEGNIEGFRNTWPYPAKFVDYRFQEYIRGKSVAIVGPAPTGTLDGEEIDSFDVIIRFNYRGKQSMGDIREYGTKTHISLYNAHTIKYFVAYNQLDIISDLDFCLIRKPRYDLDDLGWHKHKIRLIYENDNVFYKSLTGVPAVLFDVLLQGAGRVKLFKTNFYLTTQHHFEKYRGRSETDFAEFPLRKIQPIVANHDLISQLIFTQNLCKKNLISLDGQCAKLINLSQQEYFSNLKSYCYRNILKSSTEEKELSLLYNVPDFVLISHHPLNHNISVCASVYNLLIGPERVKNLAGFLSVKENLNNFKQSYLNLVKPGKTLLFNGLASLLCEQSIFAITKAVSNKTPVFVYFHETAWNFRYLFGEHKKYVYLIIKLLKQSDAHYLVTSSQALHLVAFLFGISWEKIRIVYELVDLSKFKPDFAESPVKREQLQINLIGAGTLSKRKGIDLFMMISNQLTDYHKQKINYFWYSTSQGKFNYEDQDVKVHNVQWMPFSKDFNLTLLNATALLLTSRDDPAPLVALEALACDRPVFCFQTTGIREIIPPEFICDSIDDMIKKVLNFLSQKDNYPRGFFRSIVNDYDSKAFCKRAFGEHSLQRIMTKIPDYNFIQDSIDPNHIDDKNKKIDMKVMSILERATYSVDQLTTQIKSVNIAQDKKEKLKKVVVIGNSPNVLEKKLGFYIDSCDEVIRINNFVTKGYEEYIGSKTTKAFISFACGPANEELKKLYPDKIYLTRCQKFQESDLPFLRDRMLNKENSVGFDPKELHLLDPFMYYDRLRYILNLGDNMWTTTGTVAIQWAIDNFKLTHEIFIYGFSFYQESEDNKLTRYFPGHTKKDNHHDFEAEKKYVKSLIDKKQIKFLPEIIT